MLKTLFGHILYGCYWLTNNYVLSLILFALLMQLLMLPLGIKQQKNMVKQAALRPKEMAIRKKYAGRTDQVTMQKMNNELMELQQAEGYNPLAGCLPLIIQMIIIFPLYQVVIKPLQYVGGISKEVCEALASHFNLSGTTTQIEIASKINSGVEIPDVITVGEKTIEGIKATVEGARAIPDVTLFGQDLGVTPLSAFGHSYWWLIFIPLLNLGVMYLSQFLSKKLSYRSVQQEMTQSSSMMIMTLVLPLMTMFITFNFAAAIGVYWIFRTILSIVQQVVLAKAMPYPTFTEEDYKRAEKEMKARKTGRSYNSYEKKYMEKNNGEAPPFRSLHHIDDDDD